MKHPIAVLLCCLLLCGCAQDIPEETTAPTIAGTTAVPSTTAEGLYDATSDLEQQTQGSVKVYPLNCTDAYGMRIFGDNVLILSGEETTTLTLLSGGNLRPTAEKTLDFLLGSQAPSLMQCGGALVYYDPVNRETVVLDEGLDPVRSIAAPEDLSGLPLLSEDRSTLYYCTETALRAWDLESGIRRTIKEMSYPGQTVAGLHRGGTVLHCKTESTNLFLSALDGRLIREWDGDISLLSTDSTYCAAFTLGQNPVMVYCHGDTPQILLPEDFSREYLLLKNGLGAVGYRQSQEGTLTLEYYDLTNGTRRSQLTLMTEAPPAAVDCDALGYIYILADDAGYGCSTLYRWDTAAMPSADSQTYAADYATEENPLPGALALCRQYAQELSEKHGIQILIGKEAAVTEPWDYDLEAETQPSLILQELMLLDTRLSRYPEGILTATASNFTALKLCLVRSVTGSAESGSVQTATGVQFLDGTDAYVVITAGLYGEQALYHELFHAMETHIFNYSIAFDQWDSLNPSGFEYDYGYSAQERDASIYLHTEHRSFIDRYSMSFPKEDRARIMEYAMMDGNRELFKVPALQAKLQKICEGIREAYGLEKASENFPWEQYLD